MLRGKQTIDYYNIHVSTEAKETRPRKERLLVSGAWTVLGWGTWQRGLRETDVTHVISKVSSSNV